MAGHFSGVLPIRPRPAVLVLLLATAGYHAAVPVIARATASPAIGLIAIHDLRGRGEASPLAGQTVTTSGIVTAITADGFFLQAPDDEADDDSATSEGIFVLIGGAPPARATPGNALIVTGRLSLLAPAGEVDRPPVTVISGVVGVTLVSTGHELPEAVVLGRADLDRADAGDRLARREGMRVRIDVLAVSSPTEGVVNQAAARSVSTGVFFGVPPEVRRPEVLRVDSAGQPGATPLELTTGATVRGLVGPLRFTAGAYTLVADAAPPATVTGLRAATPLPSALPDEFTVASFDLDRFFDDSADPDVGEPVLTAAAFDRRLDKASLAIRHVMRSPDIIGVQEVENLATLQRLAERVNADATADGEANPVYMAFLEEGNDPSGLDVGFLVKAARAVVDDVAAAGRDATFVDPTDQGPDVLFHHPPLVLGARVAAPRGPAAPLSVIVGQMWPGSVPVDPAGRARERARRRAQAEFMSDLVESRLATRPDERIVMVGDFDGLASGGTRAIAGFADLASTLPPAERYSYRAGGIGEVREHVLAGRNLFPRLRGLRFARNGADFPESLRNDPTRPERVSDHDMPVAYFRFERADLALTAIVKPNPVARGDLVSYTLLVTNQGPDDAVRVQVSDTLPDAAGFEAVSVPAGWSCTTPPVEASGALTCAAASLAAHTSRTVIVGARVACSARDALLSSSAVARASTADPDPANGAAIASVRVAGPPGPGCGAGASPRP